MSLLGCPSGGLVRCTGNQTRTHCPSCRLYCLAETRAAFRTSLTGVPFTRRLCHQGVGAQGRSRHTHLLVRSDLFGGLNKSLQKAWDVVRRDGRLTADNIKQPIKEIRRALLEADVSLPVVRRFVQRVEAAALGVGVVSGVKPEQQLVKVVFDQLVALMGGEQRGLEQPPPGQPQIILVAGLQGTGKTTACGKLAMSLKRKGCRVLLVATDVYRPAAIEQLVTLGERVGVDVFQLGTQVKPVDIARQGVEKALKEEYDAVIVDTAGRLQIDDSMMNELEAIKAAVTPTDTLLVVDAMTGQEAANLVKSFNETAQLTGAILTKLDGDSRGGAALSVFEVSGQPIKFVGTGEKMDDLEAFYPDRMAQRILGMGDVLTLVEKAEKSIKEEEAQEAFARVMKNKFDYDDFLGQYKMVSRMGPMAQVMKLMPGMAQVTDKQMIEAERKFKLYESLINKMEPEERSNPDLIASSPSRRRRVAREAERTEQDVTELVAMFTSMRAQMKNVTRMLAVSGAAGLPGVPQMDDKEVMQSMLKDAGPRPVEKGKVRRKKRRSAAQELAELSR